MVRQVTLIGVLVILMGGICGADELHIPLKFAPMQALASMAADGKITIRYPIVSYKIVEKKIQKDGKDVIRKYYSPESSEGLTHVPAKQIDIFDATGKKVAPETLADRLKKNPHVLVSFHGPVDPFYLRIIKDDILILVENPPSAEDPQVEKER